MSKKYILMLIFAISGCCHNAAVVDYVYSDDYQTPCYEYYTYGCDDTVRYITTYTRITYIMRQPDVYYEAEPKVTYIQEEPQDIVFNKQVAPKNEIIIPQAKPKTGEMKAPTTGQPEKLPGI